MIEEHCQEMERLAESEGEFLWSQALRITGRQEDAEDLLQETLMKVYKGFHGFSLDTNFRAWARKIMLNTHINKSRKQAPATLPMDELHLDLYSVFASDPTHVSDTDDPERVFFHNHISERVIKLLLSLSDKYRIAFLLFHFNGCTYDEISNAINVPVGTVKSRIHRARLFLAEKVRGAEYAGDLTH